MAREQFSRLLPWIAAVAVACGFVAIGVMLHFFMH